MKDAIGGYFPLELPLKELACHQNAERFNTARAAFYALLEAGKPEAVWMPRWICDAMLAPLHLLNVPVHFYSLDTRFRPELGLRLGPGEWLLYVNYFGLCDEQEQALLQRFNPSQLILDRSQAFFAPPRQVLATLYSPRKFFGVPDGGLLISDVPVILPERAALPAAEHLLQRLSRGAEAGFDAYKQAENSLSTLPGSGMSLLTQTLLGNVDYPLVEQARLRNFHCLQSRLGHLNALPLPEGQAGGPLCYPLLLRHEGLRQSLYAARIYTATFWQDAAMRLRSGDIEQDYIDYLIPLPVDHRYDLTDMNIIADTILAWIARMNGEKNEKA